MSEIQHSDLNMGVPFSNEKELVYLLRRTKTLSTKLNLYFELSDSRKVGQGTQVVLERAEPRHWTR